MVVETPSDRDYACFFCTTGKAKSLNAPCPDCGHPLDVGPLFEHQPVASYSLLRYVRRGFYGATYYGANRIGKEVAVKIIPRRLYTAQDKSFDEEIHKYQRLGSHPNIAELLDAGDAEVITANQSLPIYYIVTEWIDGLTLTEFIEQHTFSVAEIYGIILDLCSGVARFESKNLWHNDLNGDNILVKQLTPEELETRRADSAYICKIVDLGSAVFRQFERHKVLDDIRFLAQHINHMRTAVMSKISTLSKEDRYFLDNLPSLVAHILDEDPSRSVTKAQTALSEVRALYSRRLLADWDQPIRLTDPFAYLNANDFPTEAYVNLLFSKRLPWLRTILAPEGQSMLITGPRGCGKTIILKSMRLKSNLHRYGTTESPDQIAQRIKRNALAGFYVSARIEIGNNIPLTKYPPWAHNEELVNLYFNLLYTYEVIDTLHYATSHQLIDIPVDAERSLVQFVSRLLRNGFTATFPGLLSAISQLQGEILLNQLSRPISPGFLGPRFLTQVCSLMKESIPFFASKNIVFLLDDFSMPKVPEVIQRALLPSIWNSGGGYSFRVTAHSQSTASEDSRGIAYLANRDYTEVNLGASYIHNIDTANKLSSIRCCVDDILTRRFALNPSLSTRSLRDILGEVLPRDSPIAIRIRELSRAKKLHTLRYRGWQTVIRLCSGDISYIIDILRGLFAESPAHFPIRADIQHREIRQYARTELYRLQDYSATACNLYEVAAHFGRVSRFKLENSTVGSKKRPGEYLRIEVEIDALSATAKEAIASLLQSGVFIDGGFSSSAKGTPARRLIFKKLFTPVFPTTYNSRDTWPMSAKHFDEFIANPQRYVKRILGEHGIGPDQQPAELDNLILPLNLSP